MRLVPDGPDRSPWVIFLWCIPPVLAMVLIWDAVLAERYRKHPWERPLTLLSNIAEYDRMNNLQQEMSRLDSTAAPAHVLAARRP